MKKVVIIFLAAVFMLAMYVPVSAEDWNIYGSARVQTFWTDFDEELDSDFADTTQLGHEMNVVSRFGMMVDHGIVGGHFEAGFRGGGAAGGGTVYHRHLYGTVDMPFGQLLVGQTWKPYGLGSFISSQAYAHDEGGPYFIGYGHRAPMIQLTVGDFKIALVEPNTAALTNEDPVWAQGDDPDEDEPINNAADTDRELFLPQINLSYNMMVADGIALHFAGAFQTYDLEAPGQDWDGETLNAFGVTANARFTMMDPMYFNIGGFYGLNHALIDPTYNPVLPVLAGDEIVDVDSFGVLLAVGTKVNNIGLELGFGYREDEYDDADDADELMLVYANANIPLSPDGNAFIVPEIGYYDYESGGDDAGDKMYAGLKWQINF